MPPRLAVFIGSAGVTYAGMGLGLISAPILARTLGADGRGVLAGAFVFVQLLSWVAFMGLPRGLAIQSQNENQRSSPRTLSPMATQGLRLAFEWGQLFS
jgi:O-antigen/teichoic acid export membrane protein